MNFKPQIIFQDNDESNENKSKNLNIIHFNDVYNIESNTQEPVGGAARFLNVIESLINQKPTLVFFSGDALSPSIF
jgi:5'-nucleotidase